MVRSEAAGFSRRNSRGWQAGALGVAGVFALAWSVFRAAHQSITLDEADTYLWFGGGQGAKFIWYPFPNNHVLNSLLIWISTHAFGVSVLTVRIPALFGAALYISVAFFLCRQVSDRFALQFATFVCLVYNPFVLDFFAAARGYALANAFLLMALAVPVWQSRAANRSMAAACALASTAIGLSFVSNFAFAFVDAAALAAIGVWALRRRGTDSRARIIGCCVVPALVVALGLCGYPLAHYPRQNLWYGARSFSEMTGSLASATLYRLCAPLRNRHWIRSMERLLLPALVILCAGRIILGMPDERFRRNPRTRIAAALAGIVLLTLAAHFLAFHVARLPLPMSRTGIFFLPLGTLAVALVAAAPARRPLPRWLGHALVAVFLCLAAHCLLCLRYSYFKEYDQQADLKDVYSILQRLNRTYGVREFATDGTYGSPLNFYRASSRGEAFPPVKIYGGPVPPGKSVYILHGDVYRAFMDKHRLAVLYRGEVSRVVVAVPPGGPVPPVPLTPDY